MGMDVMGRRPVTKRGKYFRNNVWWWRPLADYCIELEPELCNTKYVSWHSNDGDGLDGKDAYKLGCRLEAEIKAGRTLEYEVAYKKRLEELPLVKCEFCDGTGERHWAAGLHPCSNCNGTGKTKDWAASYPFSVENVQEFSDFLKECGGFSIR